MCCNILSKFFGRLVNYCIGTSQDFGQHYNNTGSLYSKDDNDMFNEITEEDYNVTECEGVERQHTLRIDKSPNQLLGRYSRIKFHPSIAQNRNSYSNRNQCLKPHQLEQSSFTGDPNLTEQDHENSEDARIQPLQNGKSILQSAKKTLRLYENPISVRRDSEKCNSTKVQDSLAKQNHDSSNKPDSMRNPLKTIVDSELKQPSHQTTKPFKSEAESHLKTKSSINEDKSFWDGGNQTATKYKSMINKSTGNKFVEKPLKKVKRIKVEKEKPIGPAKFAILSKSELSKRTTAGPTSKHKYVRQYVKHSPVCADKKILQKKR